MLFHISAQIELVQLSLLIQVMDTTITKHKTRVMKQQKGSKITGLFSIQIYYLTLFLTSNKWYQY